MIRSLLVNTPDRADTNESMKINNHVPPIIRQYHQKDAEDIRFLLHQLGYEHSTEQTAAHAHLVEQQGGAVFTAVIADRVVGCICAVVDVRLAEGLCGELVSLIVAEEFRGIGLGRQLVTKAEAWLKDRTGKVRIRANTVRSEAHRFYQSLDYIAIKEQKVFIKHL